MAEERPVQCWTSLIDLYCEIHAVKVADKRTARRFYVSLGVLRRINGHPAVFRSEVHEAMRGEKTRV